MNLLVPYLSRWNSLNRSRYYQILKHLAGRGHEIYIIQPPPMDSTDSGFMETTDSLEANVHLIDLKISRTFWNMNIPFNKIFKKGYYCVKVNAVAEALILKYKIDAVLFYNMALYPFSRKKNILSVYDLGDDHVDLLRHELGRFANQFILQLVENILKRLLRNCNHVFTVSHYLAEKYFTDGIYLPNGVSLEHIHPGCGHTIRESYKKPVIGFVGSLEYFINFEQIIEVASILREYTFVIAGGGRRLNWILSEKARLSLDNLIVTGGLPHHEILRHIDTFDIALNLFKPSPLTDGACPIKLFEYMAFHKPIISSRIQEVQRIGEQFLYWADNSQELIQRIDEILKNPDEGKARVDTGFRLLKEMYTWDQIAKSFSAVLLKSLENNGHR